MNDLTKNLLIIAVILLVPIVPFLGFGREFESYVADWAEHAPSPGITSATIVALLATDVFLPIPSSFVSTFGGAHLGTAWGTVASSLGMTIGAVLGFYLARLGGRPLARRFCSDESLDNMHALSERYGPLVLVLTRVVPVFAEASVLIVGIHRLSWRGFLPPIIVTNVACAFAYSAVGSAARQHNWLTAALALSILVSFVLAIIATKWLPRGLRVNEQHGESEYE